MRSARRSADRLARARAQWGPLARRPSIAREARGGDARPRRWATVAATATWSRVRQRTRARPDRTAPRSTQPQAMGSASRTVSTTRAAGQTDINVTMWTPAAFPSAPPLRRAPVRSVPLARERGTVPAISGAFVGPSRTAGLTGTAQCSVRRERALVRAVAIAWPLAQRRSAWTPAVQPPSAGRATSASRLAAKPVWSAFRNNPAGWKRFQAGFSKVVVFDFRA